MTRVGNSDWEPASVPFRISIGDRPVFVTKLAVKVWRGEPLGQRPATPSPPADDNLDGPGGYYFPSFPVHDQLPRLTFAAGFVRFVSQQYRRFYANLAGPFDAYEARFSAKTRATLRRKVRKFAELSGDATDFRVFRTPAEFEAFRALAVPLSATTYQDRLLDAGLPDDDRFWASIGARAAADSVRGYLLCHHGNAVAYLCCPVTDGIVKYDFVGYAPEYRAHSPGTVLQWLALKDLMAERRFRMFDFTPGEGQHKEMFATDEVRCADVFLLRPSPGVLALLSARMAVEGRSTVAGSVAARFGLKSAIRRLLRGR
jgi:CelD/BcsL family acetyltransferase involved in cellulose biosynthesis